MRGPRKSEKERERENENEREKMREREREREGEIQVCVWRGDTSPVDSWREVERQGESLGENDEARVTCERRYGHIVTC